MLFDEIDEFTMVSEKEATNELEKHDAMWYVDCGEIWATIIDGPFRKVCDVKNGDVSALEVLTWLGY